MGFIALEHVEGWPDKDNGELHTRIEHERALLRVMTSVMKDDAELFRQFVDNDGFKS